MYVLCSSFRSIDNLSSPKPLTNQNYLLLLKKLCANHKIIIVSVSLQLIALLFDHRKELSLLALLNNYYYRIRC
jgi:hypothetical protein